MEKFTYIVIFVTTTDPEEAQLISKVLLEQKKVACANIVHKINSSFWWQGKIDSTQESLIIMKTKASQLTEIVRLVKELHRYEVPEIIAFPIIGGNQDYLEWIGNELG